MTPFFSPNIGGVETYLDDLIKQTSLSGYSNTVLTYSPITSNFTAPIFESKKNQKIIRLPHFGHNLFHRLESHPATNFLYLTPYLGFGSFVYFLLNSKKIDLIHAHGLNSAFIGIILKKIFNKPLVVNLYSNYDTVPFSSLFLKLIKFSLNHSNRVLTQSDLSRKQLIQIGVRSNIIGIYSHWIDLKRFKPSSKKNKKHTFLFVGRMVPQKGALLLAKVATQFPQCKFIFVGSGPQFKKLVAISKKHKQILLFPDIPYKKLHRFYQMADYFIFPSLYAEGWGRVAMEAVASGLPVIGSNLGAISENISPAVSVLFPPTAINLKKTITNIINNPKPYLALKEKCRSYSLKHFSSSNVKTITSVYQQLLQTRG